MDIAEAALNAPCKRLARNIYRELVIELPAAKNSYTCAWCRHVIKFMTVFNRICRISATSEILYSFYRCMNHTTNRTKGEEIMPDDFIRRMVRMVIRSFPIDEAKKTDILRKIMNKKEKEEDQ